MNSNFKAKNLFDYSDSTTVKITVGEIRKIISNWYNERHDGIYDEVKADVAAQMIATVVAVLSKDYNWNTDQLLEFKENVESMFNLMNTGVFGKKFDMVDCIEYLDKTYGINLDKDLKIYNKKNET